jgi:hypothetical protein
MVSPADRWREIVMTTSASAALCTGMHLVVSPIWRRAIGEQKYLSLKRREQLYLAEK